MTTRSLRRSENAKARWEAMTYQERSERVRRLQEGRRRARSPEALAEIERKMERLNDEFRSLERGHPRRSEIIRELRPLGQKRYSLKWSGLGTDDYQGG